MNLIEIEGDGDLLQQLSSIAGLTLEDLTVVYTSVKELGENQFSVSAYASDLAVQEIQSLGGSVNITLDNQQYEDHMQQFYEYEDEPGQS